LGLIKKKSDNAGATGRYAGTPLFFYLLPGMIVAIVVLLLVTLTAQMTASSAAGDAASRTAVSVANALAGRLEGEVLARRQLLALGLADGRVADAFASREQERLDALLEEAQRRIPGLMQLRILSPDTTLPDSSGPMPMGYAGLDMVRQVAGSGRPSLAEMHQIKSDTPYLALAVPVAADGRVIAVAFATWDMRPLVAVVETSAEFPGRLALMQGSQSVFELARGPGTVDGPFDDGRVEVPESIWSIGYVAEAESTALGDASGLIAIVGGGGLLLFLVAVLQWRLIGSALRKDMSTLVGLGEAISEGSPPPPAQAVLAASGDAIALLLKLARDGRAGNNGASKAGTSARPAAVSSTVADAHGLDGLEVEELAQDSSAVLGGSAPPAVNLDVPASLFRAYDIRGVVGDTLTEDLAMVLGQAIGSLVIDEGGNRVAVARDARLSSPALSDALVDGLLASGCDVTDLGQAPTPLLYFALQTGSMHGGVMVTASHNPADYNGFKIVVGDRVLDGQELKVLRERMMSGPLRQGNGQVESIRLQERYAEAVAESVQLTRPLKVVVDAGNGAAGELAVATLEALGCEVVPLFCEPDGRFPNHHPNPGDPENLSALTLEVQAQQADIGLAFDGDGDRLGVVDETGQIIWADKVLMLLAADVLGRHPGVDILYDVKSSRHLASFILSHGGRPIMWQSGHSRMRRKMQETGALLGGEFSGHLFIKERWYGFDDAIYAAVRVLEIMALEAQPLSQILAGLPSSPSTPEYQLLLEEGQSRDIMRALDAHKVFDDARLVELDGLRVEFTNGWGLIRPSNTVPSLTFRFEADDEGALEQIKSQFRDLLRRIAPDLQAPF
jgi:phosphomannomutase/phosphoglucomutase